MEAIFVAEELGLSPLSEEGKICHCSIDTHDGPISIGATLVKCQAVGAGETIHLLRSLIDTGCPVMLSLDARLGSPETFKNSIILFLSKRESFVSFDHPVLPASNSFSHHMCCARAFFELHSSSGQKKYTVLLSLLSIEVLACILPTPFLLRVVPT